MAGLIGDLPGLAPPLATQNPNAPTRTNVGQHVEHVRKMGCRKDQGSASATYAAIGDAAVTTLDIASTRVLNVGAPGLTSLMNGIMHHPVTGITATVNNALNHPVTGVAARVQATMAPLLHDLQNTIAKSNNHQSIAHGTGSLMPLRNGAGNLPTAANFPNDVQELRFLRDAAPAQQLANHTRLSYLLNHYGVLDPLTALVFPTPPPPLAAGAAGETELERMQLKLELFLARLS